MVCTHFLNNILKLSILEERTGQSSIGKLVVWNHDDVPLKSDVVQQGVNLARVQHFLGSQSGIE